MLMDMSRVTDQTMDLLWVLFAYLTTIVDRKLPSHYCIFFCFIETISITDSKDDNVLLREHTKR